MTTRPGSRPPDRHTSASDSTAHAPPALPISTLGYASIARLSQSQLDTSTYPACMSARLSTPLHEDLPWCMATRIGPDRLPCQILDLLGRPLVGVAYWYQSHAACPPLGCYCWSDTLPPAHDPMWRGGDGLALVLRDPGMMQLTVLAHPRDSEGDKSLLASHRSLVLANPTRRRYRRAATTLLAASAERMARDPYPPSQFTPVVRACWDAWTALTNALALSTAATPRVMLP